MKVVRILSGSEVRTLDRLALPIRVGTGPDADIRLPGPVPGQMHALIGLLDGRPFVQRLEPPGAGVPVLVNGEPLDQTRWLADGDEILVGPAHVLVAFDEDTLNFSVDFGGVDYETLPPDELAGPWNRQYGPLAEPLVTRTPAGGRTAPVAAAALAQARSDPAPAIDEPSPASAAAPGIRPSPEVAPEIPPAIAPEPSAGPAPEPPAPEVGERLVIPADMRPVVVPSRRRGVPALLLFAGLLVLGVCAWYVLTAQPVRLVAEPPDAAIDLIGFPDPRLGDRWLLRPGRYTVAVTAPGHRPLTTRIEVTDAGGQSYPLRLEPLPGRLVVTTEPPVAAEIHVDGRLAGRLPGAPLELTPGPHQLRIVAERYRPAEQLVDVAGGGAEERISVALLPDFAPVSVSTDPPGALIFVDGTEAGTTPATLELETGPRELRLELDGHRTVTRSVVVVPGEPQTLEGVTLPRADGLVRVVSEPAGASVTAGERYLGETPLEAELPPGRLHRIVISRPGYASVMREVDLRERPGATLRVSLEAQLGALRVRSEPPDAELYVDGESRGAATQELELLAVPHVIEVRKEGFETWRTEVTPAPGEPRVLNVKLLTPEEAAVAATEEAAATGGSAGRTAMRLVRPGEFRMGAPRGEQGRRANEIERDVRLTRPFLIGIREVTNREFRRFRPGHTSGAERHRDLAGGDHPVVMVSWQDAAAYCNWLSADEGLTAAYVSRNGRLELWEPVGTGYRLPTEAEWEWVARYGGGAGPRRYPWGDLMPPQARSGNYADRSAQGIVTNVLANYQDGYPTTAPVGRFSPNPLGIFDLGGNVAEWVQDRYTVYQSGAPLAIDPLGPSEGQYHVIRGSGWRHSSISELRTTFRDFGDGPRLDVGFRVARYVDPPPGGGGR